MFRKNQELLGQDFGFYMHPDIIAKMKGKKPKFDCLQNKCPSS